MKEIEGYIQTINLCLENLPDKFLLEKRIISGNIKAILSELKKIEK